MNNKVIIAVDAMGGENAPKKILNGIDISLKKNKENYFYLVGDKKIINEEIKNNNLLKDNSEIIHTNDIISDNESPLAAAKKGKETSMWKAIELLKNKKADISLSAGNTGAMLVISRLLLNTIEGITKPALAGLWPNKNNMNIVLDLGANIECDEKNLCEFASMGAALFKSLFHNERPKVALLNVGLEEYKGNENLKKTFTILKKNDIKNFEFCGFIEGNHIMDGIAFNVPVPNGSCVDLTTDLENMPTVEEVNQVIKQEAENGYLDLVGYTNDPIVSSDVIGREETMIFDAKATMITAEELLKTICWYDNGWGFAKRILDTILLYENEDPS